MSKDIKGDHKHLTLSDRVYIEQALIRGENFRTIAKALGKDPSTISLEIRKFVEWDDGRLSLNPGNDCVHYDSCERTKTCSRAFTNKCSNCFYDHCAPTCLHYEPYLCDDLKSPPYVCNGCKLVSSCRSTKVFYLAEDAQKRYKTILSESRAGINMTPEQLKELDEFISPLIRKGQPLSHIFSSGMHRIKIQFPGGTILEFRNAQFIPAFYFIPECFLRKCGSELCSIPRDFNELMINEEALKLVQSDLFVLCIVDCYAYMAWPYLCPKIPYMEIFSGDSPAWRIAHSAVTWIDELTRLKLLPTFADLFSKPKEDLYFGFVPEETVSLYMSTIVPSAVERHNLQPILDAEKEYRCFEDFDYRDSNQKIDFYRKWYHTRSKKSEFSLEGYKEHLMEVYDDDGWEVPDPVSDFEDEVVENVDVQRFMASLSEKDRNILQLRQDGYTLQEIADKLEYKTHSAVLKRINKIGRQYEKYSGLSFGFQRMT